jgi:hypothetical protein
LGDDGDVPDYDASAVDAAAGPGATAVLHGMLATLSEVLDGLDRRLAAMEGAIDGVRVDALAERVARVESLLDARLAELSGGRDRTAEALAAIGSGVGHLVARLDQLAEADDEPEPEPEPDRIGPVAAAAERLEAAVAGVAARIDALPVPEPPPLPEKVDLGPVLDRIAELGPVLDGIAELGRAVADRPVEVRVDVDLDRIVALLEAHGAAVRDEVTRLDTLLRGQVAEVTGTAGSITDVLGRLDGRLHEVVDGVRALQRRADAPARLTAVNGE